MFFSKSVPLYKINLTSFLFAEFSRGNMINIWARNSHPECCCDTLWKPAVKSRWKLEYLMVSNVPLLHFFKNQCCNFILPKTLFQVHLSFKRLWIKTVARIFAFCRANQSCLFPSFSLQLHLVWPFILKSVTEVTSFVLFSLFGLRCEMTSHFWC